MSYVLLQASPPGNAAIMVRRGVAAEMTQGAIGPEGC